MNRWIPIEDRLPDLLQEYPVMTDKGLEEIGLYGGNGIWYQTTSKVSFWQDAKVDFRFQNASADWRIRHLIIDLIEMHIADFSALLVKYDLKDMDVINSLPKGETK